MNLTLASVIAMALRTVRTPREGAEEVLALGVPREALWPILLLVIVLSVILTQITWIAFGAETAAGPISGSPTATGVVQLVLLLLMAVAVYFIGRNMGGSGSFAETLLLVSWLQFIMVCVQVLQVIALFILPTLAALLGIAGFALFLWLLTTFIAVLHGFKSLSQVFVMVIVTAFGFAFAVSIILSLFGIGLPVGT